MCRLFLACIPVYPPFLRVHKSDFKTKRKKKIQVVNFESIKAFSERNTSMSISRGKKTSGSGPRLARRHRHRPRRGEF